VPRAWQRGVIVGSSETFAVDSSAPDAVRLCLGATRRRERLESGLRILAETIEGAPYPGYSIV